MEVGQTATRSLTLTEQHVRTFAELTGDYNPLHFDEEFAAGTKFERLVVQGGLTTGILHALVAMDMPGPGTVFLSQDKATGDAARATITQAIGEFGLEVAGWREVPVDSSACGDQALATQPKIEQVLVNSPDHLPRGSFNRNSATPM